ncbi:MAG: MBL fold metallo-hydrolase [Spirochaetia bacterium]
MKIRFLGTGTSNGVPVIGCECAVCRSQNPRNKRSRASILVEFQGARVLVDAGPDLRQQALAAELSTIDAVLFTHGHADHTHGIDDLRVFTWERPLPAYGSEYTMAGLRRTFAYIMDPEHWTAGRPQVESHVLNGEAVAVGDARVLPIPIMHGKRRIYGYRFGRFAYLTDCSAIPDESYGLLEGVDVVVLDALRRRAHPTHFTVDEAVAEARRLGVSQAYLTHMCHDLDHDELAASLPPEIQPAYDGLEIELPESSSGQP